MDVDLSRLPVGRSGWLALVNHALALGDLSEVDYLELKGALSFGERQSKKRSAVVVSRAILGMANRMPDLAEKHLSGSGVVFIGIDQRQTLVGAESVDAAVLRDLIEPYVGEDGPRWDHQFIDHPEGLVLAVIVDAPQWGDRIHACRKDYSDDASKLSVRDGEVLVRVPGKTRPATSYDLEQLERRRAKAPHTGAQVSIEYAGAFDRTSRTNVRELVEGMVKSVADELIEGASVSVPRSPYSTGIQAILEQTSAPRDRRTVDEFRADVDEWQKGCQAAAEGVVTEFLRHTLGHGTFTIHNESDRYLECVRVHVAFPAGVTVLMVSATDYCDHGHHERQFQVFHLLPDRPPKYGDLRPFGFDYSNLLSPKVYGTALNLPARHVDIEETSAGCVVSWYVGDLPPRATVSADEQFAVFTDTELHAHKESAAVADHQPLPTEIRGAWQVTARAVDHVFRGVVRLTCRQEPGEVASWRRGSQFPRSGDNGVQSWLT
jgi:hypothetical protein